MNVVMSCGFNRMKLYSGLRSRCPGLQEFGDATDKRWLHEWSEAANVRLITARDFMNAQRRTASSAVYSYGTAKMLKLAVPPASVWRWRSDSHPGSTFLFVFMNLSRNVGGCTRESWLLHAAAKQRRKKKHGSYATGAASEGTPDFEVILLLYLSSSRSSLSFGYLVFSALKTCNRERHLGSYGAKTRRMFQLLLLCHGAVANLT